jgi:hypothetical protein
MGKYANLTGRKFGRLTVIQRSEKRIGIDQKIGWDCLCDCGNNCTLITQELKDGHTKSCGCYNIDCLKNREKKETYRLGFGVAAQNRIFMSYSRSAKYAVREFSIPKEEFIKIIQQDCYYCGSSPTNITRSKTNKVILLYNGVDRLDSKKGYVEGNVVPCCGDCNFMKKNMLPDKFLNQIISIYNHTILGKPISVYGEMKMCGML